MSSLQRHKILMIGSPAVGKTSLVRRFVDGIFSERYQSTIGVRIDKKMIERPDGNHELLLWDLFGPDEFAGIRPSHLRGISGYLLVADGTRPETLRRALELQSWVQVETGGVPFVLILNKHDLEDDWAIDDSFSGSLSALEGDVLRASAKLGTGVEEAFESLTDLILQRADELTVTSR